eukprot:gene1583-1838_t
MYYGFQNGLIEITPALSSLGEDPATATSTSVTPGPTSTSTVGPSSHPTLPVFMDDASIVAGAKRGFPLSTYRLRTKQGTEFEYSIENANELWAPVDIAELMADERADDQRRAEESRSLHALRNWTQDPPDGGYDYTLGLYVEIVSATGFSGEDVFVCYEVVLPDSWRLRAGNVNDGVAGGEAVGVGEESWSNGKEEESERVDEGKAVGQQIGESYPLWILPALVIPLTLGIGMPGDGIQIYVPRRGGGVAGARSGKGQSVSRLTSVAIPPLSQPIALLGHLFCISADVREDSLGEESLHPKGERPPGPSAALPTMMIQHGDMDVDIHTWRPTGGLEARKMEFFLGGSCTLKDISFVEIQNKKDLVLNRFGVVTEPSGSVRIRCHAIKTDPRAVNINAPRLYSLTQQPAGRKRSVEEILGSLRETTTSNADFGRSDNRGTRLASTSDNPSTSKILE